MSFRILLAGALLALLSGCGTVERIVSAKTYSFDPGVPDFLGSGDNGRIFVLNTKKGECWIRMDGVISPDMPRAFRSAVDDIKKRPCTSVWVMMESPGGDLASAAEIGKSIRSNNFNTTLPRAGGGVCASACGAIFISGIKREIEDAGMKSEFGFHQPYKQNGDEMKCQKVDSQASSALLQYAEAMLEPEPAKVFHKLVFETPCREMKFFTGRELIDLGIATGVNKFSLFE